MTVWREPAIRRVLAGFDKRYVDEIVLVVDECTPETERAIKAWSLRATPPVTIIKNNKRMGVGYGIRQGLKYALKKFYDTVVLMAGNGKDDPKEIPKFLRTIKAGYDYVQGSRFLRGGIHKKTPILRGLFIRLWPYVWTLLTGIRCTDVTNGYRAYKTSLLKDKSVDIDQNWLNQYAMEYYLHYKAITLGYKITEVPVTKKYKFRHRGGYSKIRPYRDWLHIVMPLVLLKLGSKK